MKRLMFFVAKLMILLVGIMSIGYLLFHNVWKAGLFLTAVIIVYVIYGKVQAKLSTKKAWEQLGEEAWKLESEDGHVYRDLNKNGKLDVYEDVRQPIEARVEDLLSQMTLEEKAATMLSPIIQTTPGNVADRGMFLASCSPLEAVAKLKITTLNCSGAVSPREFAEWHNEMQKLAERTRLGIPLTFASDPRHTYVDKSNPLANMQAQGVSSWPIPLGMAATRDEELVEKYANIAREELTAMGIRFALHPVLDVATEPRWGRTNETYGNDPNLNARLGSRYIRGLQTGQLGSNSVACCVKHFPGAGPQKDGDDAHFEFGKEQVYPNHKLQEHLKPFKAAFEENAAAVMPYYAKPMGLDGVEEAGCNFNKSIITDLLREKMQYKGIVHTDYSIISAIKIFGIKFFPPRGWGKGVEDVSDKERICRAIHAGADQIGGEIRSDLIVKLVREGRITEKRIDESCRRVLRLKFQLGLFDDPYVDVEKADQICGCEEYVKAGEDAMRRSLVLLKNEYHGHSILPLNGRTKLYIEGIEKEIAEKYAEVVDAPEQADFAIVLLDAPAKIDKRDLLSAMLPAGSLEYDKKQKAKLKAVMDKCPTIVCIKMNRAIVIPEIVENAAAIFAVFGVKEEILLEAVFGEFSPTGKLPFHMARNMEVILKKGEDVPLKDEDSLYPFGFGLSYDNETKRKCNENNL